MERNRFKAGAMSLAIHAGVAAGLMYGPAIPIEVPHSAPSAYKMAIEGHEEKLVWYKFNKLPDVTPPEPKKTRRPVRAEQIARQQIVAAKKNAPKRKQLVLTPAPELPQTAPIESPNLLAIRIKAPPKTFVAPPDIVKPQAQVELAANAPEAAAQNMKQMNLDVTAPKFVKKFVAPPRRVPAKVAEVAMLTEAPQAMAQNALTGPEFAVKAPPKPFVAPVLPQHSAPSPDAVFGVGAPPELAVVGLKPVDVPAIVPPASSPAQFSAAPKIQKNGADSAGEGKGLSVPDLYVRGAPDARASLLAAVSAAPDSHETAQRAMLLARNGNAAGARPDLQPLPLEAHSGAMKVSGAPDPRFNGRDVFMMAIQMPNLTSYSGSWLMWYADRTVRTLGLAPIAPPVPQRAVDPKYVASAAADRAEGKVLLACVIDKEGDVSGIEVVNGADARLNASAKEALSKWIFAPATRKGEPVDVDVLVEIPFKLAPRAQVPY